MSTANSPLSKLKAEATRMAKGLKNMAAGKVPAINDPAGKIKDAMGRDSITFSLVMDDKILKFTWLWADIRVATEAQLVDMLVEQMRRPAPPKN